MGNFALEAALVGCDDREKLSVVASRTLDEQLVLVKYISEINWIA